MLHFNEKKFEQAIESFRLTRDDVHMIAAAMRRDIELAIQKDERTSLNLIPSSVSLPRGTEKGDYIALDFGGTNVRAAEVRLDGGKAAVTRRASRPLISKERGYNLVGPDASADELFDFLASLIDEATCGDHSSSFLLGHTFSFPFEPLENGGARLLRWTKEFAVKGVEGKDINELLRAALKRRGAANVMPAATVNDTVASLLTASYEHAGTFMSAIYATGFNACYRETFGGNERPIIFDMNAGGFSKVLTNSYDQLLDAASGKEGEQKTEKMVSGRYIGELYRLALMDATGRDNIATVTSSDVAAIAQDDADGKSRLAMLLGDDHDEASHDASVRLAEAVLGRSARLAAAIFTGTLWHMGAVTNQNVAVDGSLYKNVPLIQNTVHDAMTELLIDEPIESHPRIVTANDASLIGAAIAAAMTSE